MNLLTLAALTVLAEPQSRTALASATDSDGVTTSQFDRGANGVLPARGRDWKMSVGSDWSTVQPRVEPDALGTPLPSQIKQARVDGQPLTAMAIVQRRASRSQMDCCAIVGCGRPERQFALRESPTRSELIVHLTNADLAPFE